MGRTGVLRQQHVLGGRNPWGGRGGLVSGFWVFDIAGVLSKYRAIDEPRHYGFWFWFLLRKRGWRRAALPRTFVAHGREACDAVESARLPRSRAETPWQPTWLPRASDADRRGRCLSCPSPERLSCESRRCASVLSTYHLSIQCLDLLCWRQKEALSQRRRSGQCARRS